MKTDLGLTFSSKLNSGSYIICCLNYFQENRGLDLFYQVSFSWGCSDKSTMCSCMEHCCHVWAGAPSCYLELLDKLQKQICRIFDIYRYCFGRCSSEHAELVPLPYSRGRSTRYSDRLDIFFVAIPRYYKMCMSTVSFLAQLDFGILCL